LRPGKETEVDLNLLEKTELWISDLFLEGADLTASRKPWRRC
jgi:hypothetical protein